MPVIKNKQASQELSEDQLRIARLRSQRLLSSEGDLSSDVAQLAGVLCGVQAQLTSAAELALHLRWPQLRAAEIQDNILKKRSILRTWCMRGSLHFLAAADVGWLVALHGPTFIAGSQRRYRELGLDEETCKRSVAELHNILRDGDPLNRKQIFELLAHRKIRVSGQGQYHILRRAGLEGVICFGPEIDNEPTYVLLSDWVPQRRSSKREQGPTELCRRYLDAYAPAGLEDLAAWSGLRTTDLKIGWKSIADETIEVVCDGKPLRILAKHEARLKQPRPSRKPIVHLLPRFDTYLLGYRRRDFTVDSRYAKRINAGGGMLSPTVLINGRAAATWRLEKAGRERRILVDAFEELKPDSKSALGASVRSLSEFLDEKILLETI